MIAFGLRLLLKSESEFSEGGETESVCLYTMYVLVQMLTAVSVYL